jgi:hypothetical protein
LLSGRALFPAPDESGIVNSVYFCELNHIKSKSKKNKKWDLAKLENSFLILTFWGEFCHKDKFAFLKSA